MTRQEFSVALMDNEQPIPTITQPQSNRKSGPRITTPSPIDGANTTTNEVSNPLHAGRHLTEIYELLELCLLELPTRDLLLAQRVSRRFAAVINTSPRLRERLFLTSRLAFGRAFKAKLNPLVTSEGVMRAIPLFFDREGKRLARWYQEGFTRLWCRSVMATTVWVYLEFEEDVEPCCGRFGGEESLTGTLGRGSWERMFVSQPSCFVSWRVRFSGPGRETYSGILKGARTMGSVLDGLVDGLMVKQ